MAVFGLNPFSKSKNKKTAGAKGKKAASKSAYGKMKGLKKKAKTCEFC